MGFGVRNVRLNEILQKFCDQTVVFHYNQVIHQALFADSEFNKNTNGLNVIVMRISDLFNPARDSQQKYYLT